MVDDSTDLDLVSSTGAVQLRCEQGACERSVEDPRKCVQQLCTDHHYCQLSAASPPRGGCVELEANCRDCGCMTLRDGCTCDDSGPLITVTCTP
jgi:hypothetical protein